MSRTMTLMKGFRSLRNLVGNMIENNKGGSIPGPKHEEILNILATEAAEIAQTAYESKGRGNITYNQHDAFGWAVYFNGVLQRIGFLGEPLARVPTMGIYHLKGREEVEHDLRAYSPDETGYVLVVTNALWYSVTHEGEGRPVITQVIPLLEQLAARFNGFVRII